MENNEIINIQKEKKCPKCSFLNAQDSKFCNNCGTKLVKSEKIKAENKKALLFAVSLFLICSIICLSLVLVFSPLRYMSKINKGYRELNNGNYEKAEDIFEEAILMKEKRSEAYIGKATAMTYNPDMTEEKKERIINVLEVGYEKSGDKEVKEYKEKLENNFNGVIVSTDTEIPSESSIYSDFEKAENFYIEWIYGQFYANSAYEKEGGKLTAIVENSDINTSEKLEEEIRKHFSEKMATSYIKELNPRNVGGKLKINVKDGVGDSGFVISDYSIDKISDTEYILTLYEENVMMENKKTENKLRCTPKNGKWVFENYGSSTHFAEKIFE